MLPESLSPIQLLLTIAAGAIVGFLSGVFGVGGGFLIVPVLNMVVGLPMHVAVGAAACQMLGPATTCVLARRLTAEDFRLPLMIFGGMLVGVLHGAELLHRVTAQQSEGMASDGNGAETVVLSIYVVLLFALGAFALWEAQRALTQRPISTGWLANWHVPPVAVLWHDEGQQISVPVVALFGLVVGFLSGLLGIGGAFLLLPGLIYLLGLPWKQAVFSSMVIVWFVAFQSTVAHAWHEHIRLSVVVCLLLSGTLGARLGVEMSSDIHPARARRSFGWLSVATAVAIGARLAFLYWSATGSH
jgi:uncharacterized membrane protein YfcA